MTDAFDKLGRPPLWLFRDSLILQEPWVPGLHGVFCVGSDVGRDECGVDALG